MSTRQFVDLNGVIIDPSGVQRIEARGSDTLLFSRAVPTEDLDYIVVRRMTCTEVSDRLGIEVVDRIAPPRSARMVRKRAVALRLALNALGEDPSDNRLIAMVDAAHDALSEALEASE